MISNLKPTGAKRRKVDNPRVRKILLFIHEFKTQYDYSPSVREIGTATDVPSTSVVMYYMHILMDRGLIEFNPRESRTVRLTPKGKKFIADLLQVKPQQVFARRAEDAISLS